MRFTGWAALLLLMFAGSLPAQEAELRCPGCTIEAELVATLIGPDEGFYKGQPPQINEGTWGDRWVVWTLTRLLLFDRDGELAGTIGQEGQGPMEWRNISEVVVVGDSLVVFDTGNARATVIGPDRKAVRSFTIPGFVLRDAEHLGGDRYALAMHLRGDRSFAGRAVLVYAEGGEFFAKFDEFDLVPQLASQRAYRKLAIVDGQIVTGSLDYALRKFTADGKLLGTAIRRPPQWTTPMFDGDFYGTYGADQTPPSFFVDLATDGDRLWTLTGVPAEDWRASLFEVEEGVTVLDADAYRPLVELVDPGSFDVVARAVFDGFPVSVLEGGHFVISRTDDLGFVTLTINRLILRPPLKQKAKE